MFADKIKNMSDETLDRIFENACETVKILKEEEEEEEKRIEITSNDAIKILKEEMSQHYSNNPKYRKVFKMAIEALETQRWIPVTERLPENATHVLVATDTGIDVGSGVGEGSFVNGECYSSLMSNLVTHWMPKPKPPIKRKDEKK